MDIATCKNQFFLRSSNGRQVVGKSFEDGKKAFFGSGFDWRNAYRFNFADQHVLQRTLRVPEVSTRFCLDSAVVTESIAWLKRIRAESSILGKIHFWLHNIGLPLMMIGYSSCSKETALFNS